MNYVDEGTKRALAMTGLRQRSQKDALTGKRIPASFAWNRDEVAQKGKWLGDIAAPVFGAPGAVIAQNLAHDNHPFDRVHHKKAALAFAPIWAAGQAAKLVASKMPSPASERRHSEEAINKTILASSKKIGLVAFFELLLKTLLEIQRWQDDPTYWQDLEDPEQAYPERGKELKEKLQKLLYNIAYSSVLTDAAASNRMRNLLQGIRATFSLFQPPNQVTNWKKLYGRHQGWLMIDNLPAKIQAVRVYIHGSQNMVNQRDRRMLPSVMTAIGNTIEQKTNHGAIEVDPDSDTPGPLVGIDGFIHGSRNHRIHRGGRRKRKTIKKKRKRTRKTRKSKRKKRKKTRKSKRKKF